jgi:hypothetical protein
MNNPHRTAVASLILLASTLVPLGAAPQGAVNTVQDAAGAFAEYKVLSGFKQPFNDTLQYHLSKGWQPVGGVSVTSWNNDLYFAQLIGRPSKSGQ